MTNLPAFTAVLSLFLMAANVISYPITTAVITSTYTGQNVQESDSLVTFGPSSTATAGIPYIDTSSTTAAGPNNAVTKTKTIFTITFTPTITYTGTCGPSTYSPVSSPLFTCSSKSTVIQKTTITASTLTKHVTVCPTPTSTASKSSSNLPVTPTRSSSSKVASSLIPSLAPSSGYFNTSSTSIKSTEATPTLSSEAHYPTSTLSSVLISSPTAVTSETSSTAAVVDTTSSGLDTSSNQPIPTGSFVQSSEGLPDSVTASPTSSQALQPTQTASYSYTKSVTAPISGDSKTTIPTSSETYASTNFDLFSPIATSSPPSVFPREPLALDILDGVSNGDVPFETNKFYTNLIVSGQNNTVFTYPYSFYKSTDNYYGFAVAHINSSQYVFGNYNDNGTAGFYFNPIYLGSIIYSAEGFSENNLQMDVSDMRVMSVLTTISNKDNSPSSNYIDMHLVSGMGFASAVYHGDLTPQLYTTVGFSKLVEESSDDLSTGVKKYKVSLYNGVDWLIYATLPDESLDFDLSVSGNYEIKGSSAVDGLLLQVAVAPGANESFYDESAGMYVTEASLEGSSDGKSASYSFNYATEGSSSSGSPMLFALPHHLKSFTDDMSDKSTGIQLDSSTKGKMHGYLTDSFKFQDDFNTDVQWLPWSQQITKDLSYTSDQLQLLASVANEELNVDITTNSKSLNMYYAGKYLDKFAYVLLVLDEIIQDEAVTNSTLERLKDAINVFVNNEQSSSYLMYDTRYGGITSSASQDGDTGADFGAAYYNDHHFHYGYFIHAAALLGMIDAKLGGSWIDDNKDWINSLVRDVANPSESDSYFPVSRMFDWFAGHSWASGLFVAGDGKNEESSSEDYNFAYGMKLWGKVVGDEAMEARGDLMIAIMAKSMNDYFLYSDDNEVQPKEIIGNKVSGILFDNKIDHTTYFGNKTQYIQGIHMIPITPISSVIRGPTFVSEEWDQMLAPIIDSVDSGWTSVLRLNHALTDPSASYEFFSQDDFKDTWLDDGLTRTWCLAFSGGLANAV